MPKKIYKELINYSCPECLKSFGNRKDYYERHTNRKNPCKKITFSEILTTPVEDLEKSLDMLQNISKNDFCTEINKINKIQKSNTKVENKEVINQEKREYRCECCNLLFSKKYNLTRHLDGRCKKKPKIEILLEEKKEINELIKQNEELKLNLVKLTTEQIPKIKEFNKLKKNLKKLEKSIPNNSSQLVNNHLINKIIEKEKKIEELDNLTKQFMNDNFPNDFVANKNIKSNNIVLVDDNLQINENLLINDNDVINNDIIIDNKPMNLILNNQIIQFRDSDNYINATQLCKAGGKKFHDWLRLDTIKNLISVLASKAGIPALDLIDSKKGGNNSGTWIHPDLAIQLAQWLSPEFSIQVSFWIRQLFTKGKVEINLKILKEKENIIREKDNILKDYEKRIKILENMTLRRQKRVIYPETNVVYIVIDNKKKKDRIYIIGKTIDLTQRLSTYNKDSDYEVVYYRSFGNEKLMDLAETMILNKLDEYREQGNRDRFILPAGENIKLFTDSVDKAYDYFN
jgi:hypothetical protein